MDSAAHRLNLSQNSFDLQEQGENRHELGLEFQLLEGPPQIHLGLFAAKTMAESQTMLEEKAKTKKSDPPLQRINREQKAV